MSDAPNDPFRDLLLDEEEQAIEEALERNEYETVSDVENSKQLVAEAAVRYSKLNTTKPVTLRIKQADLIKIKAKAKRSSIPYQTLLSAAIHDFAEGRSELRIK